MSDTSKTAKIIKRWYHSPSHCLAVSVLLNNITFLWFLWFWAARHISRANCTKINWDRHGQAAYEIFSIECRFWRSKSQFSRFKETCAQGHQRVVSLWKSLFYPCWPVFHQNGCRSPWARCLSQQALVTSFLIVSRSMTLKDLELPK